MNQILLRLAKLIGLFFSVIFFPLGFFVLGYYTGLYVARKDKSIKREFPIQSDVEENESGIVEC